MRHLRCFALIGLLIGSFVASGGVFAQDEPTTPEMKLFLAAESGDIPRMKQLLARGIDPNASIAFHDPLLIEVVRRGRDIRLIKMLLDKGAKVNAKNRVGETALMALAEAETYPELAVKIMQLLLARGADIHAKDTSGLTALDHSTGFGHSQMARALLAYGAKSGDGRWKPISWAAFVNDTAWITSALKAGAEINAKDASGETPLMIAAKEGNVAAIQTLLAAGADVNVQTKYEGLTALTLALVYNRVEAAKALLVKGLRPDLIAQPYGPINETALTLAARRPYIDIVERLVELGADVNLGDGFGTPLIILADSGPPELVKLFLDKGADPNKIGRNGITALYTACARIGAGRSEETVSVMKMLLDKGANVNARTDEGITPLLDTLDYHYHAEEPAILLVEHGAEVNVADNVGKTPLLWAAYFGYKDLLKLLLAHGADIHAKDKFGQTALRLARMGKHPDIVAILQAHGATDPLQNEAEKRDGKTSNRDRYE